MNDAELRDRAAILTLVARRKLARLSLPSYARHVFRITPAPHHELICDALMGVFEGSIRRLVIIAPPGHAKSTYTSIVFPSFYLGHHPNRSIIGVTTTEPLGKLYGDSIANIFEADEEWRAVFPGVEPDKRRGWSKDGWFLKGQKLRLRQAKDPSLVFTGAGGAIIGRRADGVVIDDAVDEATARSETMLEARKLWIKRSVYSRLKPGGWRILVGTLWAEGDVVDSAAESGDFVVVHMAAQSSSTLVEADVKIPNGVKWRPGQPYREVHDDALARPTGTP